ncbi:GAF domain-containing protein [Streptomyces sp. NPDC046985]|uniref:GAF domain-containing protein n=1 Tax=Streptomyces sp. NPDC046985 TaxID=3155377 RepID=UPI00341108BA
MSYDPPRPAGRLLLTPEDREAPARLARLRRLGLGERPEPVLDAFADRLAARTQAPYAMVNLPDGKGQFFAGLHRPERDVLNVDSARPPGPGRPAGPPGSSRPAGPSRPGEGSGAAAPAGAAGLAGSADPDGVWREVGRRLARDHGFCPHVMARRKALALEDVGDYPRFAGNPVVDEFGIRSYLGAPLIDGAGTVLGTVCVVDVAPRPWGRPGLDAIKAAAAELVGLIEGWAPPAA